MDNQYDESKILKLTPREHVRMRPGMYFGGRDSHCLHEMIFMVLENYVIQAINGNTNHIHVILHNANTITIEDFCEDNTPFINEGAGHGVETWLEEITSPRHSRYVSQGWIGTVSFATSKMDIEVRHHGEVWEYHSIAGVPIDTPKITRPLADNELTGTKVTFSPDYEVFEKNDIQATIIRQRLHELSFLLPEVTFTFVDEEDIKTIFHNPNGLSDYLAFINRDKKPLHSPINIHIHQEVTERHWLLNYIKDIDIDIAFQYVDDYIFCPFSYMNTIGDMNPEGIDTKSFLKALRYGLDNKNFIQQSPRIYGFNILDITYGLVVVISIFHPNPKFENASRWTLANLELGELISNAIRDKFREISETDPQLMDILHQKCLANYHYHRARKMGE